VKPPAFGLGRMAVRELGLPGVLLSVTCAFRLYKSAKIKVKAELSASPLLGLIIDESTNINQNRINLHQSVGYS
jgi:hypothetical protein